VKTIGTHLKLAIPHILPVDSLEPLVLLDVFRPTLKVSNTFRAVCRQELLDKVFRVGVKVGGELDLPCQNLLVNSERIVIEKGWVPGSRRVN